MSTAWGRWLGRAVASEPRALYASSRMLHSTPCVPKKAASKYTKYMMLNARNKRSSERASKAPRPEPATKASKKTKKEKAVSEKMAKSDEKAESAPTPAVVPASSATSAPAAPPPPKVVSFPRPSARRIPRPTSFLRGEEADRARTVRLEEYKDGKGRDGERVGRLAATDVSVNSTCLSTDPAVPPLRKMQVATLAHGLDRVLFK